MKLSIQGGECDLALDLGKSLHILVLSNDEPPSADKFALLRFSR